MKNDYYVYGLIDPRNNQYFYIGKGKGKRFRSHLGNTRKDYNTIKLSKIKDIRENNLIVGIEILFPHLDEETSLELEKLLIYKLGREYLSEGILTNMVPGGLWRPGDSLFYDDSYNPEFDIERLDFVSKEKFLSIKKISDFNYLKTPNSEQNIYFYDRLGNLKRKESLSHYLPKPLTNQIEVIRNIRINTLPIYRGVSICSKSELNNLYLSDKIPYTEFDIIDEGFNKRFDRLYKEKEIFQLECYVKNTLRLKVKRNNNIILFESFYTNGNLKSIRKLRNNKESGNQIDYYRNGNIEKDIKYSKGGFLLENTSYFDNGKIRIQDKKIGLHKSRVTCWSLNGEIILDKITQRYPIHHVKFLVNIRVDYGKFFQDENLPSPREEHYSDSTNLTEDKVDQEQLSFINDFYSDSYKLTEEEIKQSQFPSDEEHYSNPDNFPDDKIPIIEN